MENETINNQQEDIIQNNPTPKEGSTGALVGSIIIIFIVVAGGIYFFNNSKDKVLHNVETQTDAEFQETGLDKEEVDAIDEDLKAIEAEINAELEL